MKAGDDRRLKTIVGLSLGAAVLASAALTGCGQANRTGAATEQSILSAYRDSHLDYLAVAETFPVNPADPRIGAHLSGSELAHVESQLAQMKANDQFIQGTIDLAAKVTSVSDRGAMVTDCNLDRTVFVDGKTRQALSQPSAQRTLVYAKLQLTSGIWKVVEFNAGGGHCLV
jgi:hypothetical protein